MVGCRRARRQRVERAEGRQERARERAHLDLDAAALAELAAARVEEVDARLVADAAPKLLERRDEGGVVLTEDLRASKGRERAL